MGDFSNPEFLKLIRHASFGVAVIDLEGRFRFVNESHAKLHHRKVADYGDLRFHDLSADNVRSLKKFKKIHEEFVRGERDVFRTDSKFVTTNGVEKWFSVESFLVRDDDQKPETIVVISHDITERKQLESTARKMANRLNAIQTSDAIGVHYFVKGGCIRDPNDAFLAMAGVAPDEVNHLKIRDLTSPEWQEQDDLMLRRLYETTQSVSFLKEIVSQKTRKAIPVSVTSTRFENDPDYDGVSLVSDLSDLFSAREEAEEYRLKSELALGAAAIGLWDYDPATGVIEIDERGRMLMNIDRKMKLSFAGLLTRIGPDDVRKISAALDAAVKSEGESQTAELRIHTAKSDRIFSITGRAFHSRPNGELRLVGTLMDITDTKLFEQRILESEERFRTLAETIPQIVFTADENGHVNYVNKKWFDFTGQRPQDGITRVGIRDAIHPADLPSVREKWHLAVTEGRAFEIEYRMKTAAGAYRWVIVRASPLLDRSGKTVRWFGSCTDIDGHRRLNDELWIERDRAQQANRMKSSFLANMSHEIRTPLGAILGFTELLGDGSLPQSERNEYLGIIERNSQSLSRIVDDVLDLSKVEAGLLVLEKIAFCPRTLARDILTLFSDRARKKGLTLDLKIADDVPSSLVSDPMRIRQVINNLISNAIKFTESGGVTIEVKREDGWLVISVEDTGIGISKDYVNALFQPFVQGDETMSRKHGGTGLGLHLSRKLAEALGGTLKFDETIGHPGSRFTFSVPLLEASAADADRWRNEKVEVHRALDVRDLDGLRILVVDDAADNRKLIERFLTRTGAHVDFAENGIAAVQQATADRFDLILMDLQMPDLDGFEATKQIREHHVQTPIVALTAHAVEEIRDRCERLGFSGFLTKPVDSKSLMQVVRDLTETASKTKGLEAHSYL